MENLVNSSRQHLSPKMRTHQSSESSSGNGAASPAPPKAKIVLIGPTGVGKTSILMRQEGKGFSTETSPTIGACYARSSAGCGEAGTLELQIWDTAGEERFRAMAPMYYRNAVGALAVFDLSKAQSADAVRDIVSDLRARDLSVPPLVVLVGNKADKERDRAVSREEGLALSAALGAVDYVETSAFSGLGISAAFRTLAAAILQHRAEWESTNGFTLDALQDPDEEDKETHKKCAC